MRTNPAYAEENEAPPTAPIPNIQEYGFRKRIDLDTADRMGRDQFIQMAHHEVAKAAYDMINLMVSEYDERHNPTRPDTVVS